MTVHEAVELVLQATVVGLGEGALPGAQQGGIFVLDMGKPVRILDLARQMIQLAGLRPEQDIKIEFTGLRPGEKLFEELFHGREPPVPTGHPGLLMAMPRTSDAALVSRAIDEIAASCRLATHTRRSRCCVSRCRSFQLKQGQGLCPWTPLGTSPQTPLIYVPIRKRNSNPSTIPKTLAPTQRKNLLARPCGRGRGPARKGWEGEGHRPQRVPPPPSKGTLPHAHRNLEHKLPAPAPAFIGAPHHRPRSRRHLPAGNKSPRRPVSGCGAPRPSATPTSPAAA